MSKSGQLYASKVYDDMGPDEAPHLKLDFELPFMDEIPREAWVESQMAEFTTKELHEELARRGYTEGVLLDPKKDPDLADGCEE
jgi:hypothetical protein